MNHYAIPLLAGAMLCCALSPAQELEHKEHIRKEFAVNGQASANVLAIYNINGAIRLEGYDGDKVVLEVDKKITAKTQDVLDRGKQEFQLEITQHADSVIAYIANPFDSRPNRGQRNREDNPIRYHFELDFTVKVPRSLNLHVSTVNGGDISVRDVAGSLGVHNVNGAIRVVNAKGPSVMRTINGNVEVNYLTVPPGECDFKTLNGDIKVSYPAALAVDCWFKTFNGDFFTDFPTVAHLPAKVVKNAENRDNKTVYKLSTETLIRIGDGGPTYRFETFNGNIYLKKQS